MSGETHVQGRRVQPVRSGLPNRACEECRRKKTKCDMNRPYCSLCMRVGGDCTYPSRRKPREPRKSRYDIPPDSRVPTQIPLMDLMDPATAPYILASAPNNYDMNLLNNGILPSQQTVPWYTDNSMVETPRNYMGAHDTIGLESSASFADLPTWIPEFSTGQEDQTLFLGHRSTEDPPQNGQFTAEPRQAVPLDAATNSSGTPGELSDSQFSISISNQMMGHLINLYFEKIQGSLPLFHRPNFYEEYLSTPVGLDQRRNRLEAEDAFLLNGIFALSSRFATTGFAEPVLSRDRGKLYAENAKSIFPYVFDRFNSVDAGTRLKCLQGSILMAYYLLASDPDSRSWMMTGLCCSMAYDMGLDKIDGKVTPVNAYEWTKKEEQRRAWWAAWELDGVASTLSQRPFSINRHRMSVHLPVSDVAWFENEPVNSVPLESNPLTSWKSLRASSNQDARAWYLASKCLMKTAQEAREDGISTLTRDDLISALGCFKLALPATFDLSLLHFDNVNFTTSNWVISTHLVLETTGILLSTTKPTVDETDHSVSPDRREKISKSMLNDCLRYTRAIVRVIQAWNPDYIPYSLVFNANLIFGPGAINVTSELENQVGSNSEMAKLVLERFSEYWGLGKLLLDFLSSFEERPQTPKSLAIKRDLRTRFAILMPGASSGVPSDE